MNWETNTVSSGFNAETGSITAINNRDAQRSNVFMNGVERSLISGGFFGINNTVVGMNVAEVTNMRNAIEEYCQNIENYLNGLNPAAEATDAFKGEAVNQALTTYMNNVTTYCKNLVSQLRAFSDKLADVKNQWEKATQNMGETIRSTSGSSFAQGSAYGNQRIQ